MLNFMLKAYDPERCSHERLRWCMTGAAPVPVSLIEAYDKLGIEVHQVYGLTETCGPACMISPEEAIRKAGSTGKASSTPRCGSSTTTATTVLPARRARSWSPAGT